MSALIFKLRNVPEDEANDIRELLDANRIEFYETSAGNWGIAMPGLWAVDDDDIEKAKALIHTYQRERTQQQRQQYQEALARGDSPKWYARFVENPLTTLGIVLFCLFIVYALLSPFVRLALPN
jgi:hypothetical protein